jgi:hypothetical protein
MMSPMKSIVLKVIAFVSWITGAVHAEENITVQTRDTGAALVNRVMGWIMYFYSNVPANYGSHLAPADTADDFPGLSTVFLRIPWAYLEPQEGKYNRALLDTPAQRWIAKGKHIALCLTSSENWMTYRLQPHEVTWSKDVEIGAPVHFKVKWTWANKGVAPCYPGGFPCLTLKDAEGGIVSVLTDESLDMRDLKVGPPGEAPVTAHVSQFAIGQFAPATRPGSYDLFISVGTRDGTPTIALPLADNDGHRRYRLGGVTLQNPTKDKNQP